MPKLDAKLKLFLIGGCIFLFQLLAVSAFAQSRIVSGTVMDASNNPLQGVSVTIKTTGKGTVTDAKGQFHITISPGEESLLISLVGYDPIETISTGEDLNIVLSPTSSQLSEVVVVGYGTQKKINLTGAVAQVSGKVLENRPVANVGQALQGVVGNLNITPSDAGGKPGSTVNFNIRGATSLTSSGTPFMLVDGVPVANINDINPADIKNVTVLKDAAASAIYGARAAYGVILITTKTGAKNKKASISYNNMFGFNRATNVPNQVNSLEFAEAYNIASVNAGQSPMFSDEHIARIKAYIADPENTPSNVPNPNNPDFWSYATLDNDNVDWLRAYFKPGSQNQKHDISVSGGTESTSYYVGAGYFQEGGLLRYGNEKSQRYNLTSNLHVEPLKWLRGDLRVRFSRNKTDLPSPSHDPDIGNWVHLATTRFPNWALKDPNGHWAATSNMPRQWEGRGLSNANNFNVTGAIEIEPIKNWKINADYTYRNTALHTSAHAKPFEWEYTVSELPVMTTNNAYSTEMAQTNYNSLNVYTSYQKRLNDHFFSGLVGQQVELNRYVYLFGIKRDLISPELPSLGVATGDQNISGSLTHWANTGTFARINYNYDEKYLIELNARYDGTSKFPEGNRFGFFPSVSVGYNIAKEDFWPLQDIVNTFKIRGSYGSLGNQDVPNYLYLNTIGIGSKYGYILNGVLPNYLAAPGLVSANLTWETATTTNFGLDAALLNNQLTFSLDVYSRITTDMFGPANALPATLGAAVPLQNNADLRTRGFELSIGWQDKIGRDFGYTANLILSDNRATVIKYNNPTKLLSTYYEGQVLGEIWGYTTDGIMQTDDQVGKMADQSLFYGSWGKGDIAYKDLNGDGKINYGQNTADDHGDLTVIGNSLPRYSFGLNLGAFWKGLDINMFFQGVAKRDFNPPTGGNAGVFFWGFTGGFGSNMYYETSDFWTEDNTDAYLPKPYNSGEVTKNQQPQTRYLQNAAYMRLKNLQIGYTLPESIMSRIGLQRIRLFASGENLFTLTSLQKNFDPELTGGGWGAGKIYPLMKTVSVGASVDF